MFRLGSLVLRNILRNRRRSLLTIISSAVSLALLAMLLAIYQGFFHGEDESPSDALRMICRHKVSLTQSLPASHQAKIESVPGVAGVSAWTWFQGKYIDDTKFFARFAVDADKIFDIRKDFVAPVEQVKAFKQQRTACAVAEAISKKYNIKVGDRMTIVGDIYPVNLELTVAAIFSHTPNGECLLFHREYLTELQSKQAATRDQVGTYLILAKTADAVPGIARAVDDKFANSSYPTRTESEKEFGRSFLAFLGNIKLFLTAICAAVTFTILLVSANTVAMAVRERTREVAILRTLGFVPSEIMRIIVAESVLISIIGGAFGLGIGYLINKSMSAAGGFPIPGVKWQAAAIVLGIALVVGVAASVVPAIAASRKNIVESLRFVG
ncbi:MAG: FtsX-like permease family protein [Tepidisphaeraceae bacterium]